MLHLVLENELYEILLALLGRCDDVWLLVFALIPAIYLHVNKFKVCLLEYPIIRRNMNAFSLRNDLFGQLVHDDHIANLQGRLSGLTMVGEMVCPFHSMPCKQLLLAVRANAVTGQAIRYIVYIYHPACPILSP